MAEKETPKCENCGTPLAPAKEKLKMDGARKLDGSWNFENMVCPKCHPELVKDQ